MRDVDAPDVGKSFKAKRTAQTIYGVFLSLAGLALLVWLPSEREMVRLAVGFLVILLGGMMVSEQIVKDWFGLFGKLLPFGQKGDSS